MGVAQEMAFMYPMHPMIPAILERDLALTHMYGIKRREWPDAPDVGTAAADLRPDPLWMGLQAVWRGTRRIARWPFRREMASGSGRDDRGSRTLTPLPAIDRCVEERDAA
jgi:hypothetical protein